MYKRCVLKKVTAKMCKIALILLCSVKALLTNAPECTLKVNRMFSFEWIPLHFDFFYLMLRWLWTSYLQSSKLVRSFCQKQLTVSTSLWIKIAWALISFYKTHQNTWNFWIHYSTWGFRRGKKNGSIKTHDIFGSIIPYNIQNSFLKTDDSTTAVLL